ncbi:MAG: DUF2807 domain-containing protein [bacterium]|nr:DUF2807 domain-containing protein [bacterium]
MRRLGVLFLMTLLGVALMTGQPALAGDIFGLFGGGERGSGDIETEIREVDSFDRIKIDGSTDVFVTVGEKQSVSVTTDDNLLDHIKTRVRSRRTLLITSRGNYRSRRGVRVDITVPELTSIRISGSGDADIDGLTGEVFEIDISGSGDVTIEGEINEVEINIEGSGDVDARDLRAKQAYVRIAGSGDVDVYAEESFDGHVYGSGDIDFWGKPEDVSRHVSGSGDISRR